MNRITKVFVYGGVCMGLALAAIFFLQAATSVQAFGDSGNGGCCGGGGGGYYGGGESHREYTYNPPRYNPPKYYPQPSCTLSAHPYSVVEGDNVTISWTTTNASEVKLSGFGSVSKNGSKTDQNVTYGKTYTLTVKSKGGTVTCTDSVTVRPKPAPTCTLNATPYYVEYGGDVHLSWSTENADEVTLSGFGDVNEDGSDTDEDVTSNTTYTLTVRGNGKTVTCTDSVIVKQQPAAPTCSLNAKPYWIEHGGDVEIEWTTTNASEVTLSGFGTVSKNGSDTDENVTSDKTYTLTVKGNGKTVTCTDSVKVKPVVTPACTLTASKTTINKGESVTLNWTSTNAHSADITTIGDIPVNGSRVMYPTENFTYHADFHGHNNQDVRCSVTVTVITPTPTAPVCNIYINNYNQYTYGQPVVINWTSSNAVTGWINNGIGHVSLTGSRTVYPQNGNTTYTATFANEHGQSVTCSVIVNMAPQVPYVTLSQTPYTGLELGPMGTAAYWAFLVLWCLYAAYLIAVKRVHMSIYRWYSKVLFGDTVVMAPVARQTFATNISTPARVQTNDSIDPFIQSQINRNSR